MKISDHGDWVEIELKTGQHILVQDFSNKGAIIKLGDQNGKELGRMMVEFLEKDVILHIYDNFKVKMEWTKPLFSSLRSRRG